MNDTKLYLAIAVSCCFNVIGFADVNVSAGITDAAWSYSGSRDMCSIAQQIPKFGEAGFVRGAGDALEFRLNVVQPLADVGGFDVIEIAPAWHPEAPHKSLLGRIDKASGTRLSIPSPLSMRMLMSLYRGYDSAFSRPSWFDEHAFINVSLLSIHLRSVYEDFLACQKALLKDKFSEVERSSINFPVDRWDISKTVHERITRLSAFLRDDESITAVYIDGHTDGSGEQDWNLKLSKNRADNVTQFFIDAGVTKELLVTRYHADRYPIASNENAAGKRSNRRTTIRLERGG